MYMVALPTQEIVGGAHNFPASVAGCSENNCTNFQLHSYMYHSLEVIKKMDEAGPFLSNPYDNYDVLAQTLTHSTNVYSLSYRMPRQPLPSIPKCSRN